MISPSVIEAPRRTARGEVGGVRLVAQLDDELVDRPGVDVLERQRVGGADRA